MIVVVAKYLIPKGYAAITVFPFIILDSLTNKGNKVLLNHEKIHLKQQLELLILPFFIWYFLEYLYRLFQFKKHNIAYRNISFEREAYSNDKDLDYLSKRKLFGFLAYINV